MRLITCVSRCNYTQDIISSTFKVDFPHVFVIRLLFFFVVAEFAQFLLAVALAGPRRYIAKEPYINWNRQYCRIELIDWLRRDCECNLPVQGADIIRAF